MRHHAIAALITIAVMGVMVGIVTAPGFGLLILLGMMAAALMAFVVLLYRAALHWSQGD